MIKKILYCIGDVGYVGIGGTIVYLGTKLIKWSLTELEKDFKN